MVVGHAELSPWLLQEAHHIAHFEMINVVVAVKLFKDKWQHRRITVHCDNMACVNVLQTGRGRDPFLLQCAREIWLLSAIHDFTLLVQHCRGHENILADCLSRWHLDPAYESCFWQHAGSGVFCELDVDPRLFKLTQTV